MSQTRTIAYVARVDNHERRFIHDLCGNHVDRLKTTGEQDLEAVLVLVHVQEPSGMRCLVLGTYDTEQHPVFPINTVTALN